MNLDIRSNILSAKPSIAMAKPMRPFHRPAPSGVLPMQDLRRIVAEMLG